VEERTDNATGSSADQTDDQDDKIGRSQDEKYSPPDLVVGSKAEPEKADGTAGKCDEIEHVQTAAHYGTSRGQPLNSLLASPPGRANGVRDAMWCYVNGGRVAR
jgi:hypothetical protein